MSDKNPLFLNAKNQKTVIISIGVLVIIVEVITGLLGEMMPDDFKNALETWAGKENYKIVWLGTLISIVAGLVWLTLKKDFQKVNSKIEYTEELRDKIIRSLLLRYKERHRQKLDDRIELNLELKYTKAGTDATYVEKFFASEAKSEEDLKEKLVEVLNKNNYLLIIGEPGAGKTTILLELAVELLENADSDKKLPIPIIFNLSSWNESFKTFGDWLVDVLVQGNGFSKAFAMKMIDENQILPLLDGLDELASNSDNENYQQTIRNKCLIALEDFMTQKGIKHFVICSRINEYAQINANAPVNVELLVKNLEIEQVIAVLEKAKLDTKGEKNFANPTAAANLLVLLQENEALKKIVCVPFYFNTIIQIVSRRTRNYIFPTDEEAIKDFVVKEFIAEKICSEIKEYKAKDILKWTSWLAKKLNQFGMNNFELISFDLRFVKKYFLESIFGALCSIIVSNSILEANFSINFKVVVFLLGFYFCKELVSPLQLLKRMKLNRQELLKILLNNFIFGIVLFCSIQYTYFFEYLFSMPNLNKRDPIFNGTVVLNITIIRIFFNIHTLENYSQSKDAYSRYNKDVIFKLAIILPVLCTGFIIYYFSINNFNGLVELFLFYFPNNLGFIIFGLCSTSLFVHFLIRILIFSKNNLPFKFVTFFNILTQKRILEYEFGSWRFRHKIIQDYFAYMDIEEFKNEYGIK